MVGRNLGPWPYGRVRMGHLQDELSWMTIGDQKTGPSFAGFVSRLRSHHNVGYLYFIPPGTSLLKNLRNTLTWSKIQPQGAQKDFLM